MAVMGWKRLLADGREFRRPGRFPIAAYSEFMPPPRLVRKPYGTEEPGPYAADDPCGWQVSEYEEALQLRPGMEHLAAELVHAMEHLGHGRPAHGISQARLADNPFWPPELADRAGTLSHERYVVLSPLALSQTQDDKGRVRWTLFGGSEQGPARGLLEGILDRPRPRVARRGRPGLLLPAAGAPPMASRWPGRRDLRRAGFRILPGIADPIAPLSPTKNPCPPGPRTSSCRKAVGWGG